MAQGPACVKCGSTDIISEARVIDRDPGGEHDLHVRVDADPDALFFEEAERCPVHARVCGHCGYTELYADDPGNLLAAWRRSQESSKG